MSEKTVSLTSRQVNQSLSTRQQASDRHLQRQKGGLELERRYSCQQLDSQRRSLQGRLRKLRLQQRVTAAFRDKAGEPKEERPEVPQHRNRPLLQPIHDVINPYPVTFSQSDKVALQRTNKLNGLTKLPGISNTSGDYMSPKPEPDRTGSRGFPGHYNRTAGTAPGPAQDQRDSTKPRHSFRSTALSIVHRSQDFSTT